MHWAIITGASSGIGKDSIRALRANGMGVIACVRNPADIPVKAEQGLQYLRLDITNPELIRAAVAEVTRLLNGARVSLVNNAGSAVAGPVEGLSMERWREQFDVNLFGMIQVTQAFLPLVRKTGGRIVNVSSISGIFASPYLGAYAASKFAVEAMSDALRRELVNSGVKV
ncbi:MAG: SDR family NAD(P)-dependent oxidoreductase, partial [Proteobacteria bacterium]